ncbi:stem cell self-renewal protein Piwi, partial [Karstenula rhodostoma CBS 690.94]
MASNLALKVNMKYGGDTHHLPKAELEALLGATDIETTAVFGADVAHPPVGGREGAPSVACLVGSVDAEFMSYRGTMRLQAGRQEKIHDMRSMVKELLMIWKDKNNGQLPTSILFYRDGVSESQFVHCRDYEIVEILEAYRDLIGKDKEHDKSLKLTFVVVGKRHNTRFYAKEAAHSYVNGNLKPGLLVEDVVTDPSPYNFYLQSHQAIKGTARSAHYHVLRDDMQLGSAKLPSITHLLCFAFGRATKGVSYVAPAYMADRLCDRGQVYLRPWNDVAKEPAPRFQLSNNDKKNLSKEEINTKKQKFAEKLQRRLVRDVGE